MFLLKILRSNRLNCKTKNLILTSLNLTLYLSLLTTFFLAKPAAAQRIVPNNDGTATIVTKDGRTFNISGGTLSGNGKNLFHSLQEFGLDANQIANFLSTPNIRNILTRINGGNPSIINGLIQVSGGNSNLYLMNPSGIIFGKNASLNVPGSFTATTATGIGLDGGWFEAFGNNNYQNLIGNVNGFKFAGNNAGVIINAGDLKVAETQNLSLVGGQVINLGTIEAPGGKITIAAVPGTSLIRISQEGQLLSLELELPRDSSGNILPIQVADLPALLTANPVDTGLSVDNFGEVKLNNTNTTIPNSSATTIVSGNVNASGNLGGEIQISGQKVGLVAANINASGNNGGGEILIGGDYQGNGNLPNAEHTYVSQDSVINADAINNGNGGKVIVWADRSTQFYGNISATGGENSGNGGFAEVSGKESLVYRGLTDLRATQGEWGTLLLDPTDIIVEAEGTISPLPDLTFNTSNIVTLDPRGVDLALNLADLTLQANNNITINNDISTLTSNSLTLQAGKSITVNANITLNGGNFSATINDPGANPLFRSQGQATFSIGGLNSPGLISSAITTNGGSILIRDGGGNFDSAFPTGNIIMNSTRLDTTGGLGTGTINLIGNNSSNGNGISIDNSRITSSNGDINLTGIANGTLNDNNGIRIVNNSAIESTGTGNITLTGTGGNGTSNNHGILLDNNASITSQSGLISLTGTAGNGVNNNNGIFVLNSSSINSQNGGNINLLGRGNGTGAGNVGINLNNAAVQTTGIGTISLDGTGGNGTANNRGIEIQGAALSGGINTPTIGSIDGNITLIGRGNGTQQSNTGILLNNGATIQSTGTGNVNVTGIGGNGTSENRGIEIQGSANPSFNTSTITTNNGNISLTGTGRGTGVFNLGIFLNNGGIIESTGTGNIDLTGIAPSGTQGIIVEDNSQISGNRNIVLNADLIDFRLVQGTISPVIGGLNSNVILNVDTINLGDFNNVNSLTINARNAINTGNILANRIALQSNNSSITTANLNSVLGNVQLNAATNIQTGTIFSLGNVGLNAGADVQTGTIFSASANLTGNNVTVTNSIGTSDLNINARNVINTGDIFANRIALQSNNNITTGNLASEGGNISLTSTNGAIATGNIDSSAALGGGNILVDAEISITAGAIDSSAISGNAGNVTLDPIGDIQVRSINAQSEQGRGGIVDITTQSFFRATESFRDRNNLISSISTAGGIGGGAITIRHGGNGISPFIVGDALNNGTAGAITSGEFTIASGSFLFTEIEGNISIISLVSPNTAEIIPPVTVVNLLPATPQTSQNLKIGSIEQAQQALQEIQEAIGQKPALIYVNFIPRGVKVNQQTSFQRNEATNTAQFENYLDLPNQQASETVSLPPADEDLMELLVVTPDAKTQQFSVPVTRQEVESKAEDFYESVSNPFSRDYFTLGEQMYSWMILPIREKLETEEIDNLVFVMPPGLRFLPIAAMRDRTNNQFLVEQYSLGLAPSVNLIDFRYENLKNQRVLGGGASIFEPDQNQNELPAAALEVSQITTNIRQGKAIVDRDFTLDNFIQARETTPYPIVHLATHADFQGDPQESYLQFYDRKLPLEELRKLGLRDLDLMVISACRSAFGDENAELGFGGLAVQAGVKSALASLWFVDDIGTFTLMTEFYRHLGDAPIKAEALREAQVNMIQKKVRIDGGLVISPEENIPLPEEIAEETSDLSHPFYWSGFTMIGSPW